jgi:hypothetical protein
MKRALIFLFGVLLFAGCNCENRICDCFDDCDNAISFSFSTDSLTTGFKVSEIDTIILYKIPKGRFQPIDSLHLILDRNSKSYNQNSFCSSSFGFALKNGLPFQNADFQDFDYQIKIPAIKAYKVTDLVVEGRTSGDKCCSCYTNEKKTLVLDGVPLDLTNKNYQAGIITLKK